MKNYSLKLWVFVCVCVLISVVSFGCNEAKIGDRPAESKTPSPDSITITNIKPTTAIAGTDTTFDVTVSYTLISKDSGEINIGFNNYNVEGFGMIDKQIVSKGSGAAHFSVKVTPVNWGTSGDFQCLVNLSENPHPQSWSPLASYKDVIDVSGANPNK